MKKIVKTTLLLIAAIVTGAVSGNLLGKIGLETPVIVVVILTLFASLYGYKTRTNAKKYVTQS